MKNKQPKPERVKDPKKVAAGKARAAKGLRLNGQFVTNYFKEHLKETAAKVGFSGSLQKFLDQNEIAYSKLYHTGKLKSITEKSDTTVFKELESYKGVTTSNGKRLSPDEIKFNILQVEQWLFSNTNTAGIAWKPTLYFDGNMEINFPSLQELEELFDSMDETEAVQFILDEYGIRVWLSPRKRKGISEEENDRRNGKIERKMKSVNKALRDAKTKSRTRRKRS